MNFYPVNGSVIDGWDTLYGSGSTAMSLDASASSQTATVLNGALAMLMAASGNAAIQGQLSGIAAMTMTASANWQYVTVLDGVSALLMSASAAPSGVQYGGGAAALEMFASHGLPVPPVIPGTFYPAHKLATMIVPHENRVMVVPPEQLNRAPRRERMPKVGPDNRKV